MAFDGPNAENIQNTQPVGADGGDILGLLGTRPLSPSEMEMALRLISDNGNEGYLSTLGEMASVSSGKLGYMREGAEAVDASVSARTGSREYDISATARMQEDPLAPTHEEITVAYMDLTEAGIDPEELNQALASVDPLDPMGTMKAMADLAQEEGVAGANWTIEAMVIENQVNQVVEFAALQDAERLRQEQLLKQELDNPYKVAGTDMNGPAAARPV